MGKDKVYGLIIFLMSVIIALYYSTWVILLYGVGNWSGGFGSGVASGVLNPTLEGIANLGIWPKIKWAWILPVWGAVTLILVIAAWIGWTMLTTPPPVPLEDLEEFEADEED